MKTIYQWGGIYSHANYHILTNKGLMVCRQIAICTAEKQLKRMKALSMYLKIYKSAQTVLTYKVPIMKRFQYVGGVEFLLFTFLLFTVGWNQYQP